MTQDDPGVEWWRGCMVYQIYPRSFQDTTGNGVGDLAGIIQRLPHVASLGVDAVWLSPFFKSPMKDMGYDVSDYCAVDPLFGSLDDFDALVTEAHRLGLKVIIDQVISHTSDQHSWFKQSRGSRDNDKADWYVWADAKPDGTAPNNWLSVFGGLAWDWDSTRRQYYMHSFLASQPQLNFHNAQVQEAVLNTVQFWLERGVDGFRFDSVNYYFHDPQLRDNPPFPQGKINDTPETNPYGYQVHVRDKTQPENLAFLRRLRSLLDRYPDRTTVGEVGDEERSLQTVADYTSGHDKLHMCYTFDLLGPRFSAQHVHDSIAMYEQNIGDGWVCWAFSNHDVMRHVSRWFREGMSRDQLARFSIRLLVCLRGSLCLYQGEELGLQEAHVDFDDLQDALAIRFWPALKGRDGCRTPMVWEYQALHGGFSSAKPWLPVSDTHRKHAVDAQLGVAGSVLEDYRSVLQQRQSMQVLKTGSIRLFDTADNILAFLRHSETETVFCAFNFSETGQRWLAQEGCAGLEMIEGLSQGVRMDGPALDFEGLGVCVARVQRDEGMAWEAMP